MLPQSYLNAVLESDIKKLDDKKYDVSKMSLLLRSLARNESTTATRKKLINDIIEFDGEKIDDDTIIKLMVSGNKEERVELLNRWNTQLSPLASDPKVGKYATLLLDATPYVICKNVLLLNFDFERLAYKVNIKSNQNNIASIVEAMLLEERT